jgi:hypothetical protein
MKTTRHLTVIVTLLLGWGGARAAIAQELETETARLQPQGKAEGGGGIEYQRSSEGSELALPTFAEAGLSSRLELVIEPVVYTSIRPKAGAQATGVGDVEVTLVGLITGERGWAPAVAAAAEVKIPTARNAQIGTRETDYAGYVILSKAIGSFDVHVNVSFTYVGRPAGLSVDNVVGFATAGRYRLGEADLFAEVLASTAATPEGEMMGGAAELSGSELVATLGAGYRVTPWMHLSLGLSYDNNQAVLIHPGFILSHQLF